MGTNDAKRFTPEEIAEARVSIDESKKALLNRTFAVFTPLAATLTRILEIFPVVDAEPRGEISPPGRYTHFNEWCDNVAYWHIDVNAEPADQLERMAALCISESIRIRTAGAAPVSRD